MSYILLKSYRALTGGLCLLSLFCCQPARQSSRRPQAITEAGELLEQGEFTRASLLIDSLRQTGGISDAESSGLDSISDWMGRIRRDFSRDGQSVREQLSPYYHPLDDSVMLAWERSGKLEMRLIDGQKRYFSNAVPNLFRLDSAAARRKQELDGYAVDQSFKLQDSHDKQIREFYMHGIDAYRLIVNDDYARELYPPKKYRRSEPYDFQRGELEWSGGNLYFDKWSWDMKVVYHPDT